jgi:CHASE1-domain containing sensor protein
LKLADNQLYLSKLSSEYSNYDLYETGIQIYPETYEEEAYIISYFEPFDPANKYIGFDVKSQPERLRALVDARDTGLPSATSKIKLLNDPNKEPSLVIYLPIYQTGYPINTIIERREALVGFVSVAFKMESIMGNVFSKYNQEVLNVEIYDVTDKPGYSISNLLYDSDRVNWNGTKHETTIDFELLDRNWKLLFTKEVSLEWVDYEMRNINLLLIMSLITGSLLIFISYDRFK